MQQRSGEGVWSGWYSGTHLSWAIEVRYVGIRKVVQGLGPLGEQTCQEVVLWHTSEAGCGVRRDSRKVKYRSRNGSREGCT